MARVAFDVRLADAATWVSVVSGCVLLIAAGFGLVLGATVLRRRWRQLLLAAAVARGADTGVRIAEVAPGVFAALQPEARRFNESNSLFVVRQDAVLVIEKVKGG